MTSPDFSTVAPKVSATPRDDIDKKLARLVSKKDEWVGLGTRERAELLEQCMVTTLGVAREWVHAIGKTPIVRINRLAPSHVTMYVKCEFFNPLSSVKDRLAIGIIEDAERRGTIKPGQTVVEATSGNTGIALAMVCAAKGYPFVATMAESFSIERRNRASASLGRRWRSRIRPSSEAA